MTKMVALFYIFFCLSIKSYFADECPGIQNFVNVLYYDDYAVVSYLHIPSTNILLVNTLPTSGGSSIVYYVDNSTKAAEVIAVIKPDYDIKEMIYVKKLDLILVINSAKIILANPYTLVASKTLQIRRSKSIWLIQNSNYAIVTMWYNEIRLLDTETLTVIKIYSNLNQPNTAGVKQHYSSVFTLVDLMKIILCSNEYGVFTWTIDIDTLEATYNGYIPDVNVWYPNYGEYRTFDKHPTEDIFFFSGFHSQIVIVKILDISQKQYLTMFDQEIADGSYDVASINLLYKEPEIDGVVTPMLIIGDTFYVYKLPIVIEEEIAYIDSISDPTYYDAGYNYYRWYQIEEQSSSFLMATTYYTTTFGFTDNSRTYSLYEFQRRIMYQGYSEDLYVIIYQNQLFLSLRSYPGDFFSKVTPLLIQNPMRIRSSMCHVKNCEECIFLRLGSATKHYMTTTRIFPFNSSQINLNLSTLSLKWTYIGQNLDPFFQNGNIWVILAFPTLAYTPSGYLFLLVNSETGSSIQLKVGPTDPSNMNENKSSYAIVSLENQSNEEIIGVDLIGNIYVWEYSDHTFKFSRTIQNCFNSEIGEVFTYQDHKWLITVCDDRIPRLYDFTNDITIELNDISLSSMPLSLKAFSELGILVITDFNFGDTHLYKFDPESLSFSFFITLTKGKFKDEVISVELLKENILWIQYSVSNLFFEIGKCIADVNKCKYCTKSFYFDSTETYDSKGSYGLGTKDSPFTSSANYYTAMLKAQLYTELVGDTKIMQVDINVNPEYPMKLRDGLLECEFSSVIALKIQKFESSDPASLDKQVTLSVVDKLQFNGYNYVSLTDTIIDFSTSASSASECGLRFYSITDTVLLKDIRISTPDCYRITTSSSDLIIDSFKITNQDFTNYGSIITVKDSNKLSLSNLKIDTVIFGKDTSIVSSGSQLQLNLNTISITSASCADETIQPNDSLVATPLFSAGQIQAIGLEILDNVFCKKNILVTAASLDHINLVFSFEDVLLKNNQFQAASEQLFFQVMYFQRVLPSHKLNLKDVTFESNSLIQKDGSPNDLSIATMIIVNKIENIDFSEVHIINQNTISLATIEEAITMNLLNSSCLNDQPTFDSLLHKLSIGCLSILEIQSLEVTNLKVDKKMAYDSSLISIQNIAYTNAIMKIKSSKFINLLNIQTLDNTVASPIMIKSVNKLDVEIEDCEFTNNILKGLISSFTFSTNAIWVQNYVGIVKINHSTFQDSSSNSKYNYVFISCRSASFEDNQFLNQSFQNTDESQIQGGFLYLQTANLDIKRCVFNKSRARKGSFLYQTAFGDDLIVTIEDSVFEEGYALIDGGAMFFNIASSMLTFNCVNCQFKNIYTLTKNANVIAFQQESKQSLNRHLVSFNKGSIVNWFGIEDNFFTSFSKFVFEMKEFDQITSENFTSDSLSQDEYDNIKHHSQGSLIYAELSNVTISQLIISDLSLQSANSAQPLLISSLDSTIKLSDSKLINSSFNRAVIEVTSETLSISACTFSDIIQANLVEEHTQRLLQNLQDIEKGPSDSESSLIIVNQSGLIVNQQSTFERVSCSSNCNGSTFQLRTPTYFTMTDVTIFDSKATFGGALFISGLSGISSINNCKFEKNTAEFTGGSIYLQAATNDEFSLLISDSKFNQNSATKGKGGAMFIRSDSINNSKQVIDLSDSEISSNDAQVGGSIDVQGISPTITNTDISNNIGNYFGSNMVSYPSKLKIAKLSAIKSINNVPLLMTASTNSDYDLLIQDFQSGESFPEISFEMMTDQNELIKPLPSDLATYLVSVSFDENTSNKSSYTIRGSTSVNYENSAYTFSDLQLVGIPQTTAILNFESPQIFTQNLETNQYVQGYQFKVKIEFRNCQSGEKFNQYSDFTECQTCASGTYSFDLKSCYDCPIGAMCEGGNQLKIKSGYWRVSKQSEKVLLCQNQETNCIGGTYGDNLCYEGHIGALCEECDIFGEQWGKSYAKSAKYSCVDCSSIANNFWIVAGLTIWTLISMTLAIKGDIEVLENKAAMETLQRRLTRQSIIPSSAPSIQTIRKSITVISPRDIDFSEKNTLTSRRQSKSRKIASPSTDDDKSGIYIKMLTNYVQIVGSIATFNLSIPSGIVEFPSSIGEPLQQTLNSLDCVLKDLTSNIPIIYLRLLFSQIIPCFYMLVFIIGLVIQHKLLGKVRRKLPIYVIATAFIFLVIYVQPDLVAQSIALISCREIGGNYYILSNVSFECYTDDYTTYTTALVLPILLIWVVILPVFLFLMLKRNQDKLQNTYVKLTYGFLYKEYKEHAFYWEFVKMAEKLAIILSLNFYSQSIVMKGILVFIVITIYGIMALVIQPYLDDTVNSMDFYSTNICAVTVLLGIFIYKNQFDYFVYSAFGLIITVNLWYLILMMQKIIHVYLQKFKEPIQKVLEILAKKIPSFAKFLPKEKKRMSVELKEKIRRILKVMIALSPEQKKKIYIEICLLKLGEKQITPLDGDQDNQQIKEEYVNEEDQEQNNGEIELETFKNDFINSLDDLEKQPAKQTLQMKTKINLDSKKEIIPSRSQLINQAEDKEIEQLPISQNNRKSINMVSSFAFLVKESNQQDEQESNKINPS